MSVLALDTDRRRLAVLLRVLEEWRVLAHGATNYDVACTLLERETFSFALVHEQVGVKDALAFARRASCPCFLVADTLRELVGTERYFFRALIAPPYDDATISTLLAHRGRK